MPKPFKQVALLFIVIILTSCATPLSLHLKKVNANYEIHPEDNNGHIFIYRESEHALGARGIYITANGQRVGGVNNGTYFVYDTMPGEAEITAENLLDRNSSVKRKIMVERGNKYYIRASFKTGFWDAKPYIEIVYDKEGEQAIKSLSYEVLK